MKKNKNIMILVLCITIVFSIAACSTTPKEENENMPVSSEEIIEHSIEGIVNSIESGKDGITAEIMTENNKVFSATISMVTTEILGDLGKIQKGTKIKVTGELWGESQLNMTVRKAEILDSKLDSVTNLRATVKSIEPGKDGITVEIMTEDDKSFSATISMVTTEIPVGKIEDIKEGTKLWISGEVIELDTLHIAANTVLVNPVE